MSVLAAWAGGFSRVRRAPALLFVLWLTSLAITVPPALALNRSIVSHLGESLEADRAADGVNFDWMQEFRAQAGPLGRTLRPDVIGFAAVMDNTSALADLSARSMVVIVCGLVFVALLWFLTPGLIHRLAIGRPLYARGFLATCGAFGFRMVRLALLVLLVYAALFGSLHSWLFDDVFDAVTRNITVERNAFLIRLSLYAVFFLVAGGVNVLFDYARVRLVVEDRHSIVAAVAEAARFIRNNPRVALGVYVMNLATFGLVLGVYYLVAPGAGSAGWSMWGAFAIGQAYIAARVAVKLSFWASEIVALQARFGCPGFVRAGT